jgi:uncharacterized RDD family membrane protein YckC
MTGPGPSDPAGEQPVPPPPAAPPPAAPPPAAPPPASNTWTAMSAPVTAGPAGYVYADVPNRAIAYIIDAIILAVIGIVVAIILGAIGLASVNLTAGSSNFGQYNFVAGLIFALVATAINGAYFVYTWTTMRASPGQKVLGMQVGNAADGATLTMEQAIKRWIALGAPFSIAQALNPLPGLGVLIGLASLAWFIALLWTTAQSPTKQGLHDQYANTVVVKAARAVG